MSKLALGKAVNHAFGQEQFGSYQAQQGWALYSIRNDQTHVCLDVQLITAVIEEIECRLGRECGAVIDQTRQALVISKQVQTNAHDATDPDPDG